ESIRDEKVKLLKSIRPLHPAQVPSHVVRGQYTAGEIDGKPRLGYRQEPKVSPTSQVETFVAMKLFVDNWRWSGVPFYLRTGKSLPLSASEVRVNSARRQTYCLPRNAVQNWMPMQLHSACSLMKESPCVLT